MNSATLSSNSTGLVLLELILHNLIVSQELQQLLHMLPAVMAFRKLYWHLTLRLVCTETLSETPTEKDLIQ